MAAGAQAKSWIHKAYAYSRQVFAGAAPTIVLEEKGTTQKNAREASYQYYFYAEVNSSSGFQFKHVWLKGKRFDISDEIVTHTPVVLSNENNKPPSIDTFVAKSHYKVLSIQLKQENPPHQKISASLANAIKSNDVVLQYSYKGNLYFYRLKKLKEMNPLALQ